MTKTEEFNAFWASRFGYMLTEAQGLSEWSAFVENEKTSMPLLRKVVGEYAETFASRADQMLTAKPPTLTQVKGRYFALINERQVQRLREEHVQGSTCTACRGTEKVIVLSPMADDYDHRAYPQDFRHADPQQYRGIEYAPCPVCHPEYFKSPMMRMRFTDNSAPADKDGENEILDCLENYR